MEDIAAIHKNGVPDEKIHVALTGLGAFRKKQDICKITIDGVLYPRTARYIPVVGLLSSFFSHIISNSMKRNIYAVLEHQGIRFSRTINLDRK
jgi:hypothetical protein